MKKLHIILFSVLAGCLLLALAGCSSDATNTGTTPAPDMRAAQVDGEILVKSADAAIAAAVATALGGTVRETTPLGDAVFARITLPSQLSIADAIARCGSMSGVQYAEPNYLYSVMLTPNDPDYAPYQYCHMRMETPLAWDISTGSSAVTVAVVDTGIDGTHPEFAGRMVRGYDFIHDITLSGVTNSDDFGHGTHVAGIIAAAGNDGHGVAGMAWGVRLMPVKVMDSEGQGSDADIAQGILYAASNGAKVINVSLGGRWYAQVLKDAIDVARAEGCGVVASMGNTYARVMMYPAAYPGVIAVGSTDANNHVSDFSTRGSWISVSAPGSDIYSTVPGGGYAFLSGTSMAAPQVTGLYALLKSIHSDWTPEQIRTRIENTADDLGVSGFDEVFGHGRINARRALADSSLAYTYGTVRIAVTQGSLPIGGINCVLRNGQGETVATTLTNDEGMAIFHDIPAGTYQASATIASDTMSTPITAAAGATRQSTIDFP